LSALKEQLQTLHKTRGVESTCHSIAFTSSHDFAFLDKLRATLGTKEGGFQYAEPGDGANALQEKLECVFDVVASQRVAATLVLAAPPAYQFVVYADAGDELRDELVADTRIEPGEPFHVSALLRRKPDATPLASNDNDDNDNDDNDKRVELSMRLCLPGDVACMGEMSVTARRVPADKSGAIRAKMLTDRLDALEQRVSAVASSGDVRVDRSRARRLFLHTHKNHTIFRRMKKRAHARSS
jgi:hypothetical protein